MFPKKIRLPFGEAGGPFKKIYSSAYFLLKSRSGGKEHNRFAVVVSASAVRKSTRRHYWKRRIAERLARWPNFKKDFLIILSPKIENADKKNIKLEFDKALKFLTEKS